MGGGWGGGWGGCGRGGHGTQVVGRMGTEGLKISDQLCLLYVSWLT